MTESKPGINLREIFEGFADYWQCTPGPDITPPVGEPSVLPMIPRTPGAVTLGEGGTLLVGGGIAPTAELPAVPAAMG